MKKELLLCVFSSQILLVGCQSVSNAIDSAKNAISGNSSKSASTADGPVKAATSADQYEKDPDANGILNVSGIQPPSVYLGLSSGTDPYDVTNTKNLTDRFLVERYKEMLKKDPKSEGPQTVFAANGNTDKPLVVPAQNKAVLFDIWGTSSQKANPFLTAPIVATAIDIKDAKLDVRDKGRANLLSLSLEGAELVLGEGNPFAVHTFFLSKDSSVSGKGAISYEPKEQNTKYGINIATLKKIRNTRGTFMNEGTFYVNGELNKFDLVKGSYVESAGGAGRIEKLTHSGGELVLSSSDPFAIGSYTVTAPSWIAFQWKGARDTPLCTIDKLDMSADVNITVSQLSSNISSGSSFPLIKMPTGTHTFAMKKSSSSSTNSQQFAGVTFAAAMKDGALHITVTRASSLGNDFSGKIASSVMSHKEIGEKAVLLEVTEAKSIFGKAASTSSLLAAPTFFNTQMSEKTSLSVVNEDARPIGALAYGNKSAFVAIFGSLDASASYYGASLNGSKGGIDFGGVYAYQHTPYTIETSLGDMKSSDKGTTSLAGYVGKSISFEGVTIGTRWIVDLFNYTHAHSISLQDSLIPIQGSCVKTNTAVQMTLGFEKEGVNLSAFSNVSPAGSLEFSMFLKLEK